MGKRNYNEVKLQIACVQWFMFEYQKQRDCLWMVNNESRSAYEMAKNKKMGLTPGVSDLMYLTPNGKLVCIELKWDKNRQSKRQKAWQKSVEKHNAEYHVVKDVQDFINIIRSHN